MSSEGVIHKGHRVNGALLEVGNAEALQCSTSEPHSSDSVIWDCMEIPGGGWHFILVSFFSPITSYPILCAYDILYFSQPPACFMTKSLIYDSTKSDLAYYV